MGFFGEVRTIWICRHTNGLQIWAQTSDSELILGQHRSKLIFFCHFAHILCGVSGFGGPSLYLVQRVGEETLVRVVGGGGLIPGCGVRSGVRLRCEV